MQSRKIVIGIITIFTVLILSACAGANEEENTETESNTEENVANNNEMDMEESDTNEDMEGMDHSGMNHSSTGEIPEGLQEADNPRSEEHTSELQSRGHLVCRLLLEKKKNNKRTATN